MRFDNETIEYISGKKFSSGANILISKKNEPLCNRFQIIESLCINKTVVHLGCVDHLPLINKKIKQNVWLHARLCKIAKRCLGIDINNQGIDYLKYTLGYNDVICADILSDIDEINDNQWDYLVLGEVLEHINDPCLFLQQLNKKYKNKINRVIITVPNAFSWQNIRSTFSHNELINTDHRYWFTPFTLAKILNLSGFAIEEFNFCELNIDINSRLYTFIKNPRYLFYRSLFKLFPATRSTSLMVAKL